MVGAAETPVAAVEGTRRKPEATKRTIAAIAATFDFRCTLIASCLGGWQSTESPYLSLCLREGPVPPIEPGPVTIFPSVPVALTLASAPSTHVARKSTWTVETKGPPMARAMSLT